MSRVKRARETETLSHKILTYKVAKNAHDPCVFMKKLQREFYHKSLSPIAGRAETNRHRITPYKLIRATTLLEYIRDNIRKKILAVIPSPVLSHI